MGPALLTAASTCGCQRARGEPVTFCPSNPQNNTVLGKGQLPGPAPPGRSQGWGVDGMRGSRSGNADQEAGSPAPFPIRSVFHLQKEAGAPSRIF